MQSTHDLKDFPAMRTLLSPSLATLTPASFIFLFSIWFFAGGSRGISFARGIDLTFRLATMLWIKICDKPQLMRLFGRTAQVTVLAVKTTHSGQFVRAYNPKTGAIGQWGKDEITLPVYGKTDYGVVVQDRRSKLVYFVDTIDAAGCEQLASYMATQQPIEAMLWCGRVRIGVPKDKPSSRAPLEWPSMRFEKVPPEALATTIESLYGQNVLMPNTWNHRLQIEGDAQSQPILLELMLTLSPLFWVWGYILSKLVAGLSGASILLILFAVFNGYACIVSLVSWSLLMPNPLRAVVRRWGKPTTLEVRHLKARHATYGRVGSSNELAVIPVKGVQAAIYYKDCVNFEHPTTDTKPYTVYPVMLALEVAYGNSIKHLKAEVALEPELIKAIGSNTALPAFALGPWVELDAKQIFKTTVDSGKPVDNYNTSNTEASQNEPELQLERHWTQNQAEFQLERKLALERLKPAPLILIRWLVWGPVIFNVICWLFVNMFTSLTSIEASWLHNPLFSVVAVWIGLAVYLRLPSIVMRLGKPLQVTVFNFGRPTPDIWTRLIGVQGSLLVSVLPLGQFSEKLLSVNLSMENDIAFAKKNNIPLSGFKWGPFVVLDQEALYGLSRHKAL